MPKQILTILTMLSLVLLFTGSADASWLDKLKETATELTDKASEALKEAEPEAPSTSDGEGQVNKPATTAAPSKPAAPATQTVTKPAAPKAAQPAPVAKAGNNNKILVRNIQQELKRLGYKIGVDGAYGPNTKKQIMTFEQSQSLEPSGDASVELLAKLKETPTPKAEPATATATAAPKAEPAPAPKAEEPKAPEPKVEQAAAPAMNGLLKAIFEKDEKYNGGRLAVEYPNDTHGKTEYFSVRWLVTNNKKYAEIAPVRQMRGEFKAQIKTANNDYEFEGICDISCPRSVPEAQWAQVYDEFAALSKTGGSFEFSVETTQPNTKDFVSETFKVRVPSSQEQATAVKAEQEKAAEIAAAKQAEKDKQAAAQQAKADQKAAVMTDFSPEGKMIYENCDQNSSAKNFYDCQCIAANSESYIGPAIDSQTKGLKTIIAAKEDALEKNLANPNLTAEKKAQMEDGTLKYLAKQKAEVAKFEDRANWDRNTRRAIVNSVEQYIYKDSTCKIGEGWREKEYKTCMSATTLNNMKGNKSPEEFCSCSADTVAKLWTGSNQSYSSKVAVGLPAQARTQCRK